MGRVHGNTTTKKCFIHFFFRSIFTAFFAQKGVLNFRTLLRGQFLEYKDAVFCVCFRIINNLTPPSYFFRFLPHFSKKLRSIPMIYFFEKKNEKNEKMDDTGSHIIVAPH